MLPLIPSSPTDSKTTSFFSSILSSSRNLFILGDFNSHYTLWDSKGTFDAVKRKYLIGQSPLTFSPSMTLTYILFSIAALAVAPPLTSPLFFDLALSIALSCSREVLQNLGSDRLPILLTVPLSSVFCPNERLPFLNFQKAC